MKVEKIIEAVSKTQPGSFFRISYVTELPVKSSFKKQGYQIIKEVSQTSRTGCRYKNIKDAPVSVNPGGSSNFEWIMKNSVNYNHSTNKFYLNIYPISKGAHTVTTYHVIYNGVDTIMDLDDFKNMVIDSYWKTGTPTKKKLIAIDNINKIACKNRVYM